MPTDFRAAIARRGEQHLEHALTFSEEERANITWLSRCLPSEIIDSHTHTSLVDHISRPFGPPSERHMMTTYPGFSIELARSIERQLLPGHRVRVIRFPHVFVEIDRKEANRYLLDSVGEGDSVVLCGILDDPSYTVRMIRQSRAVGLKMDDHDPGKSRPLIRDYFPHAFTDACKQTGKPIILHLPRPMLDCIDELEAFIQEESELKIILPHCGLNHIMSPGIQGVLGRVAEYSNVFLDTARVHDAHVLAAVMSTLGADRLLFGSDGPLNLLRSRVYMHPRLGKRLAVDYSYHWLEPDEYDYMHLSRGVQLSMIEQLRAILAAVSMSQSDIPNALQRIFAGNASRVFSL